MRRPPTPLFVSSGSIGRPACPACRRSRSTFASAKRLATPVVVPQRRAGGEEPQPIGHHRSAERGVEVEHLLDAVDRRQPLADAGRRRGCCSAGHRRCRPRRTIRVNRLPPSLGMLFTCAPPSEYSADPIVPEVDDDFLDGQRVDVVAAARAFEAADAGRQRVVAHAVLQQARVERLAAVHGDADRALALAAAHVLRVRRLDDGGNQRGDAEHALRRRHRVEHLARDRALLRRALHVHQRRGAGDGDGLLELTDLELGVHLGGEVGPQLEALALDASRSRRARTSRCTRRAAAPAAGTGRARR